MQIRYLFILSHFILSLQYRIIQSWQVRSHPWSFAKASLRFRGSVVARWCRDRAEGKKLMHRMTTHSPRRQRFLSNAATCTTPLSCNQSTHIIDTSDASPGADSLPVSHCLAYCTSTVYCSATSLLCHCSWQYSSTPGTTSIIYRPRRVMRPAPAVMRSFLRSDSKSAEAERCGSDDGAAASTPQSVSALGRRRAAVNPPLQVGDG